MQPGINDDNFSSGSQDSQDRNQYNNEPKRTNSRDTNDWDTTNRNELRAMGSRNEDRDQDRYSNDQYNDSVNNSWDAKSKTYNQDEDSWEEEKSMGATTANRGTQNNDWDANDQMQRGTGRNDFDDETRDMRSADDYIDSDHASYNRSNDRFRWNEPEEEEE